MKKYGYTLLCILFSLQVWCQQRIGNFTAYGKESGLGQNSYHDVFESSDGYLWIGSNSGLFKFDGKRFKQIISAYSNPNSPGENNTVGFAEDNNGNLWIAGFTKGVTKYNLKTGHYSRYPRLSADSNSFYGTNCIYKQPDGTIWIGTSGRGIAKYITATDSFRLFYPNAAVTKDGSTYGENVVTGIIADNINSDLLWLSGIDGLYNFNTKTGQFTGFHSNIPFTISNPNAFLNIEQSGNQIFLGTWFAGLVVFDKQQQKFKRIEYKNAGRDVFHYGILDLQFVADSLLYLAAMNDGLLCYHMNSQTITPALTTKDISYLNTEINIQRISMTPHAGFFAGGNANIYQLHPNAGRFSKSVKVELPKLFPDEQMNLSRMRYSRAENGYWTTFDNFGGIVWYSSDFSEKKTFTPKKKKIWFRGLAIDGAKTIWVIGGDKKLYYLNSASGLIEPATELTKTFMTGINNDSLRDIAADSKGNLWLAGYQGMYHYTLSSKKLLYFSYETEQVKKRNKTGILYVNLVTDSKDNAWMSSNAGLFKFDLQKKQTTYYADSISPTGRLANISIKSFTIDKDDHLWLGYFNDGIQKLNTREMKIERSFSLEDGLSGVEINYLACDSNNNIIACLHNGLAIYKPSLGFWQVFNAKDGLQRDYLDVAVFSGANNRIILDQVNGFLVFTADSLSVAGSKAFSHITTLLVDGKPYSNDILPDYINSITLPPGTNDILIEFSVTNWESPFRTKYFYRVDGVHRSGEWLVADEAKLNFTGLSSGEYTFRFYAITGDGKKTAEKILHINIRPPFYKTWWFMMLCVLAISFILYTIYKYRIKQIKKLQDIRNNIAKDLHDEIGSTLTSIKILSEVSENNVYKDQVKTSAFLQKIKEQSASAQQGISDIVWALKPENDKLENMVIRMREYISHTLESKNIPSVIDIDEQVLHKTLDTGQRRDFFLIFKEAINNIAKYAAATTVHISLAKKNNDLVLQITDDGKGFDTERQTSSSGIKNMRSRSAALNGSLLVESIVEKGTSITLTIPTT